MGWFEVRGKDGVKPIDDFVCVWGITVIAVALASGILSALAAYQT